eukprot:scaffold12024_cov22-Tisochrysis_lutea.AAC.2
MKHEMQGAWLDVAATESTQSQVGAAFFIVRMTGYRLLASAFVQISKTRVCIDYLTQGVMTLT